MLLTAKQKPTSHIQPYKTPVKGDKFRTTTKLVMQLHKISALTSISKLLKDSELSCIYTWSHNTIIQIAWKWVVYKYIYNPIEVTYCCFDKNEPMEDNKNWFFLYWASYLKKAGLASTPKKKKKHSTLYWLLLSIAVITLLAVNQA